MSLHTDRHKQVECNVCFKTMRTVNVMRHRKSHADLYSMDEVDARVEHLHQA